jgi:hypothetical protein
MALAACNSQEPAEPEPTQALAIVQPVEPTMPPPDETSFAAAYAEACPNGQKVSTSLCKSQGLGKEGFICDYGLGNDEYRRKKATVVPGDGKWTLAEPEKICAADAA